MHASIPHVYCITHCSPTLVCLHSYFIPEDGDVEHQPNVFLAPRSHQPLTLQSIQHAFPLPGRYHFRFKTSIGGGGDNKFAVWMDVTDAQQPIPSWRGGVHLCKVTRMGVEEDDDDDEEDEAAFRSTATTATANAPPPQQQQPPAAAAPAQFDLFDQQQQQQGTTNLLGGGGGGHHGVASAPASGGSLLDMNYAGGQQQAAAAAAADFLGGYPAATQQQQQRPNNSNSFDLGGAFF